MYENQGKMHKNTRKSYDCIYLDERTRVQAALATGLSPSEKTRVFLSQKH